MKANDEIRVFAKLGLMKEPRWLKGKMLEEHFPEDGYLVEVNGNKIWAEKDKVKRYEKLSENDVIDFENKTWESLKKLIIEAMNKFFPNIDYKINEEEKIISANCDAVTIGCDKDEVESIVAFRERACWSVLIWKTIPATRFEPQDVDSILFGNGYNVFTGASIFMDGVWKSISDYHFEDATQTFNCTNI